MLHYMCVYIYTHIILYVTVQYTASGIYSILLSLRVSNLAHPNERVQPAGHRGEPAPLSHEHGATIRLSMHRDEVL